MDVIFEMLFLSPNRLNSSQAQSNASESSQKNNTLPSCQPAFSFDIYYLYGLIPACTIVFFLGFTTKRKQACHRCCAGRPGIVVPLNLLDSRSRRFSYSAAYGLTAYLCIGMFFSELPVKAIGPKYLSVFFNIIAVLVYGTFFYPIFACLTADHVIGYAIGTLWVWQFGAVWLYQSYVCANSDSMYIVVLLDLPFILCLLYLTFSFPWRMIKLLMMKKNNKKNAWKEHYQAQYVRRLFRQKKPTSEDKPLTLKSKIIALLRRIVYSRVPGFRYSTRVICTYTVSFIVIYLMGLLPGLVVNQVIRFVYMNLYYILLQNPDSVLQYMLHYLIASEIPDVTPKMVAEIVVFYIILLEGCFYFSLAMSAAITILMMIHSLSTYRKNILELYTGKDILPDRAKRGNASLTAAAIRYAGYQVAYVAWGFMLVGGVLLLLSYTLMVVVIIPVIYGYGDFFIRWFMDWWPGVIIVLGINFLQLLLAKVLFLQQCGAVLAINNRNVFFIFTFYMFFFNLFVGLVSCLLRIVKSAIIGLVFMSRLDHSSITRRFETMDPGYSAYIGFLYVEEEHTHPVLTTFCQLLIQLHCEKQDAVITNTYAAEEESAKQNGKITVPMETNRISQRARIRWFVAYTLIHNLSLRFNRKDALDPLKEVLSDSVTMAAKSSIPDGVQYVECVEYGQQRRPPKQSTVDLILNESMSSSATPTNVSHL